MRVNRGWWVACCAASIACMQVALPDPALAEHCGVPNGGYCSTGFATQGLAGELCTFTTPGPNFDLNYEYGGVCGRADDFSMSLDGYFELSAGLWRIDGIYDNGVRAYMDGDRVVDHWVARGPDPYRSETFRIASGWHRLRFEYFEETGHARLSASLIQLDTTPPDTTPPVIAPSLTPPANTHGWHNDDVALTWSVSDPESPVESIVGCADLFVFSEPGATAVCSATNAMGLTSSRGVSIRLDRSRPTASVTSPSVIVRALGTIFGTASDGLSGVATVGVTLAPQLVGPPITLAATCTSACGTTSVTWSVTVPADVSPGLYSVTAASSDLAGNAGPASNPTAVVLI